MRYIDAITGSLLAFPILLLAAIFLPSHGPSEDISLILTVSTFLFAILYGFFITRSFARYNYSEETIASEDAHFLSLYRLSKLWGTDFSGAVREAIDKYYIVSFDFELGKFYKQTEPYFELLYDLVRDKSKLLGDQTDNAHDDMLDYLAQIENGRNRLAVKITQRMTRGHWLILLILGAIILFSLYLIKTTAFHSVVSTSFLAVSLVLVLLVLRDLDNLRLGGVYIAAESGQELFESIGKPRYYSDTYMRDGTTKIPKHIKKFRRGFHRPGEEPNVRLETNPSYKPD